MYADRIKQIRDELNLSVAKLSKKIEIPERTIGSYEREERTPSLEFVAKLCNILNINPYWFITGNGPMFNPETSANNPDFEHTKKELLKEVRKMLKEEGITEK